MKNIFLSILLIIPLVIWGQNYNIKSKRIDSIHVEYMSLCEFLTVKVSITDSSILYYQYLLNKDEDTLIYKTRNSDTIACLQECIRTVWCAEPIYDTNEIIIDDCRPGISLTIFCDNVEHTKWFYHYYKAMFPFAYTEMYHIILTIIRSHRKPCK